MGTAPRFRFRRNTRARSVFTRLHNQPAAAETMNANAGAAAPAHSPRQGDRLGGVEVPLANDRQD